MRTFGKVVLGILASLGVLFIVLVGAGVWGTLHLTRMAEEQRPEAPEASVLTLDLDQPPGPQGPAALFSSRAAPLPPLLQMAEGVRRAADDPRITGLFATLSASPLGMAGRQELRAAIEDFRAAGKPAILFSETLGEGNATLDYYLASAFSEIWLQPSGSLAMVGLSMEMPFLREALAEIGVSPAFSARHEYKSAMDSLTRADMAAPVRRNLNRLMVSWFTQIEGTVAEARGLSVETLRRVVDRAPLVAAEALDAGLIDRLGYRDQVTAEVDERLGEERIEMAGYLDLITAEQAERTDTGGDRPRIALLDATGPVVRGEGERPGPLGGEATIGGTRLARQIVEAGADEEIDAILLHVDSPGGSYVASDTVWRAIEKVRAEGTPVVALMADVAGSGGYFIAMNADRVIARGGTVTGSIGVVAGKFVLADLWDKLGVTWEGMMIGANAGIWSPNRDFTPAERARFNHHLDVIYADFVGKAAAARGVSEEAMDGLARGRVFSGADALDNGLIDALGGYPAALEALRELLDLPAGAELVVRLYPPPKPPLERLLEDLQGGRGLPFAAARGLLVLATLGERAEILLPALEPLAPSHGPLTTRLPARGE